MIIDTSAVIAVIGREPGHQQIIRRLAGSAQTGIGAPTQLETGMVLIARFGTRGKTALARFLQENGVDVLPFGDTHVGIALDAFSRFGKGRHPAALNFGDCCSYATATVAREPLLSVGDDFPQTDLELVRIAG
jgi:ribonuclease VapC